MTVVLESVLINLLTSQHRYAPLRGIGNIGEVLEWRGIGADESTDESVPLYGIENIGKALGK